ncbi:MAG: sulfite exporter TauE/SafE family protein [Ilumatobacteraceae bacterium]
MTPLDLVLAGGAGFAAGAVNAIAGGGTLISFPVLVALGVPPVSANVTNTVALSPGYLGGALAQRDAIKAQEQRVRRLALFAAVGGLTGSVLLVLTSDDAFRVLIPALLFLASGLLATQDRIRKRLRSESRSAPAAGAGPVPTMLPATVPTWTRPTRPRATPPGWPCRSSQCRCTAGTSAPAWESCCSPCWGSCSTTASIA